MIRNESTANDLLAQRANAMQAANAFWNAPMIPTRRVIRRSWFARLFGI